MNKRDMLHTLKETSVKDMPYILIPSYRRPDFKFASRILPHFTTAGLEKVFIFVREEQYNGQSSVNILNEQNEFYLCQITGFMTDIVSHLHVQDGTIIMIPAKK